MKYGFVIFTLLIIVFSQDYGQLNASVINEARENNTAIILIGELITEGEGSKIYIAKYKVLKVLEGKVTNDTISVGYYSQFENKIKNRVGLLELKKYKGNTEIEDYYIFPDYKPTEIISNVKLSSIDFNYWEGCETGIGECKPLKLIRKNGETKWFLILPCGGISTTVYFSEKEGIPSETDVIYKSQVSSSECPPIFDLTELKDGKYFAYMLSCNLGGQIEIMIETKTE